MKDKEVVEFFKATLDECRETIKGLRGVHKDSHGKYMCRGDYTKKKPWQFKVYAPQCKPKTKRAVNLVKTTLLRADNYFDFDTPKRSQNDPQYQQDLLRCNFTRRLIKAHLDSRHCAFIDNFCEALEGAFGYSGFMVLKWWVGHDDELTYDTVRSEVVKKKRMVLRSKAVDPFLFDFTPCGNIQIEHQYITVGEAWKLADEGILDAKRLKKVIAGEYGDARSLREEDRERLTRLGLLESKNKYRKQICLSHYWGPVINKDGRIEATHQRFIVGNEAHLLTDIKDNPYYDKSTPYVYDSPIKVAFRHIGKSLTEDVNSIEDAINKFMMLQLDNLLWNLLGINEVDAMSVDSKTKEGLKEIYPGMMLLRRPGLPELNFKHHEIGSDPSQAMPILQELRAVADSDHGINEYMGSGPGASGISSAEQSQRRADSLAQFEGFATDMERGIFTRCIDKARDLIVQFMTDPMSDPNAQRIMGEEGIAFDEMLPEERKELVVTEYNIVARGVSIFFEKMRKMNAHTGLYKILGSLPEDATRRIKWDSFLDDIFEFMSIDNKDDKLKTDDELAQEDEQAQQQQQEMMRQEMEKIMAPIQAKLQQAEMFVQERMTMGQQKMQLDMQKTIMKIQADIQKFLAETQEAEKERKAKMLTEQLKLLAS